MPGPPMAGAAGPDRWDPGSFPRPSAPPDDGMLRIRGGIGGLTFQFEELLAGAASLDGLVRQLAAVEVEAESLRRSLFPYQFDSYASGSDAIIAVGEGGLAVGRVRSDFERLAREVRASHREYEFTEAANALLFRMGLPDVGQRPPDGPGWPALWGVPPLSVRDSVERGVAAAPARLAMMLGIPAPVAGIVGALNGPTDVRRVIRDVTAAPGFAYLRPRPVGIVSRKTRQENVDLTPAGLLLRVEEVSRTNGEIELLEVDTAGRRAWVVVIPGTQPDGGPGGTNPFDTGGIAEGLGYGSAETATAIRRALWDAGAGAGDQVVAVGYSQGGIHAMNLGQDKAFIADFDLRFVLTAGSPVGAVELAPGISSLHLEHEHDWVPGADGAVNADTRDKVTVTLTNPLDMPALQDFGLGPGHRLASYVAGAAAVTASSDPSLLASTAALSAVVGVGGAATINRVSLRRDAVPVRQARVPAQSRGAEPSGTGRPEAR